MKINTIMNLACVRLDVKTKDVEKVMKHEPDALTLFKGEGEERYPEYGITIGSVNGCCIQQFDKVGAAFVDVEDTPTLWICLPEEAMKHKGEFIVDEYGMILNNIRTIETQIKNAVGGVESKIAALKGAISDVFDKGSDE